MKTVITFFDKTVEQREIFLFEPAGFGYVGPACIFARRSKQLLLVNKHGLHTVVSRNCSRDFVDVIMGYICLDVVTGDCVNYIFDTQCVGEVYFTLFDSRTQGVKYSVLYFKPDRMRFERSVGRDTILIGEHLYGKGFGGLCPVIGEQVITAAPTAILNIKWPDIIAIRFIYCYG